MSSAPIRQPRGPPSSASTFTPAPVSTGPPPPDAESILRRNKTLATPRTGAGSGSASGAGGGMPGSAGMVDNGTGAGTGNGRAGGGGGGGAHAAHRRSFGGVAGGAHAPGSGASAAAAAAAGGMASDGYGQSRYRSGSFSGNVNVNVGHGGHPVGVVPPSMPMGGYMDAAGLIRRASQRDQFGRSGTEETLLETEAGDEHDAATERGTWGKGLARQSSLPSRRLANGGVNPGLFTQASNTDQSSGANNSGSMPPPPPRPPRRVYHPSVDSGSAASPPPATSTSHSHAPSQSLSSLSMINIPPPSAYEGGNAGHSHSPVTPVSASQSSNSHGSGAAVGNVVGVSRTQSLRAHMNPHPPSSPVDVSTLGRSASMRAPGELHYSRMHASPPPVHHPFSAATPPRKGAALHNTFQYPPADDSDLIEPTDLKRHQSLTYGSSNRMRERLERSQALLSLDQREDLRRRLAASPAGSQSGSSRNRHSRHPSEINVDESPSNPIGRSVWTPGAPTPGDDGWSGSPAQLQDALDALSISRDGAGSGTGHRPPPAITTNHHPGEEPAWVTNLVGMPGQPSPQAPQRPLWDERSQPSPYLQGWNGAQLQPPLGMFQQQQQQLYAAQAQLKLAAAGLGGVGHVPVMPPMHHLQHGYPLGQGYLGAQFTPNYATPPGSAVPHLPGMASPGIGPGVGGAPLSAQDIDVIELARSKGLNPATFDCRPPVARFFVIKSYTEDDVQKSLKHEIWSSTVLGNKRLDTAFRESSDKGPIYLFFSVNGSRHFCGVATMLTPVDETQSSTVWAQDKWKGIFKVRWIFVRDVPTTALRHIRLTNTPERKPITNSRDTQELPYEAGCEVLQIFLDHQHKSKTSLLQDFAYYERLSATRAASTGGPSGATSPVPSGHMTPQPQQQPLQQQQAYRV